MRPLTPVSYTHLDVYKRQALTPYLRFGTYILREMSAPDEFYINDDDFEVKIARQDVYKRQQSEYELFHFYEFYERREMGQYELV